jgi:hypothetical protein
VPVGLREWVVVLKTRPSDVKEHPMGKTGRKRRARKKKAANHGKRPNA